MAARAALQFHSENFRDEKGTKERFILVFVSGKSEISFMSDVLRNTQNRGLTANLCVYDFHAGVSDKDKDLLTSGAIRDLDDKSRPTQSRLLTSNAQYVGLECEGEKQRIVPKPDITNWSERAGGESGVTFGN